MKDRDKKAGLPKLELEPWVEKVWGRTRRVYDGPNCSVHELEVKAGGRCSVHRHYKANLFHIQAGRVVVELFGSGEEPATDPQTGEPAPTWWAEHGPGDQMLVGSGDHHRFRALEESRLLEVYWNDRVDPDDIDRYDEGGLDAPTAVVEGGTD